MEAQKTILCPVDFSKGSDRAVEQAGVLANAIGAQVELLHVYQLPALGLPDGMITMTPGLLTVPPEFIAKRTAEAQDVLEMHRDQLAGRGVRATTQLIEGNPTECIVERAKQLGASMLVLGTHGHSGFKRFVLGSTAERVLRLAEVPVLTVPLAD
jgi:nucleotide-binding universal stress UspA family protein